MDAQTRVSGALAEGGNFEGFTLDIFKDYWTPENTNARFPVHVRVWITTL